MGMFDDVLYENAMPLPDGYQGRYFQTKDFGCDMATYKITAEGRVMQPLDSDDSVAGAFGGPAVRWRDMHFHGRLHFYTLVNTHPEKRYVGPDNPGQWHGYLAKFTDGQLVLIEPDRETDAAHDSTGEKK